jgi:H+/Cl- antiporter ClcA
MFLLIYFAFKYQFMFSKYAFGLRQKLDQSAEFILVFQAVVVSLIVILLNSLLRIVIHLFTKLKRHHSHTSEQSSFCFYYTLLYVFNACFMVYLVHGEYSSSDFA